MVLNQMNEKSGGNDYNKFAIRLKLELAPILQELSRITRIVWMQQAPIILGADTVVWIDGTFQAKIHHYNAGIRTILKYQLQFELYSLNSLIKHVLT